jgi:hypothetical protein
MLFRAIPRRLPALLLLFTAACGAAPMAAEAPPPSYSQSQPGYADAEAMGASPSPAAPEMAMAAPMAPSAAGMAMRASTPGSAGKQAAPNAAKTPGEAASAAPESPSLMIVYTASLAMWTPREAMVSSLDQVIDMAVGLGGYLSSRSDTTVEVRVPSPRFREALAAIEKIGEVTSRSVNAQDVSEEFHDLEVRLTNLKATRKRLEEFLAKSGTMQDMLSVERELERVAAEIDRIEGRLRFLKTRAAFSTITVSVTPKPDVVKQVPPPTPPAPPPREIRLPIDWLDGVGLDHLLELQ